MAAGVRNKMFRKFFITAPEWDTFPKTVLDYRDNLEEQLYILLNLCTDENIVKTVLYLPRNVTIKERHKLHKFNKKYKFECESNGDGNNRVMKVFISKKYIVEIFNNNFKVVINTDISQEPESNK